MRRVPGGFAAGSSGPRSPNVFVVTVTTRSCPPKALRTERFGRSNVPNLESDAMIGTCGYRTPRATSMTRNTIATLTVARMPLASQRVTSDPTER